MIRSCNHSIHFLNPDKRKSYDSFLNEYRKISSIIGNSIWNDGYKNFNVSSDNLDLPKYLDYNDFKLDTWLSARTLSSIVTQLSGLIRGAVKVRKGKLFMLNKLKEENKPFENLLNILDKTPLTIPDFIRINPELSSKNIDFQNGNHFDLFVAVKCIGINKITIPIKKHRLDIKWQKRGKLLGSVCLTDKNVTFRYDVEPEDNQGTKVVGGDQGKTDVLNLSDKQVTQKVDNHNHSLDSILDKLSKRKKGTKAFKRTARQRRNFINWTINQLNFSDIKELKLENIFNITYKKNVSRKMSHWTNTIIRDKVMRKCEETKVLFTQVDSTYNSQQCPECYLVRKSNRNGKLFKCKGCGYEADADQNGAYNVEHRSEFPDLGYGFRNKRLNLGKGFYWKPSGVFTFKGEELKVPHTNTKE